MRYIPITVSDEYVLGDNVAAGAAGSHNDVALVITFGEMWEGTAKTIVWHDANGENPTLTLITDTMKDENGAYVVPIPAEPKAVEGEMLMTIKGVVTDTTDTSKEKSATMTATARFFVLGSAWDAAAESSADVNATAAAQLQTAIDAETAARTAAVSAEEEAREAAIAGVNTAIKAQETSLKSYVDSSVANAVTKKDITAEVKNALESADMPYVNKSGDTMTGGLTVSDTLTVQDKSAAATFESPKEDVTATVVSAGLTLDNGKMGLALTEKSFKLDASGGIATEQGTQYSGTYTTNTYKPITFDKNGAYVSSTPTTSTGIANKSYVDSKAGSPSSGKVVLKNSTAVDSLKAKADGTSGALGAVLAAKTDGSFSITRSSAVVSSYSVMDEDGTETTEKLLENETNTPFLKCDTSGSITLTNLKTPTGNTDAANKKYVDEAIPHKPKVIVLTLNSGDWQEYTGDCADGNKTVVVTYYQDIVEYQYSEPPEEDDKCDIQLDCNTYQTLLSAGVVGMYTQNLGIVGDMTYPTIRVFATSAYPKSEILLQATATGVYQANDYYDFAGQFPVSNYVTIRTGAIT